MGEGVNSYTEKLFAGISSLMEESCRISGRAREAPSERPACRRPAPGTAGEAMRNGRSGPLCQRRRGRAAHGQGRARGAAPRSSHSGFHPGHGASASAPGARRCFSSVPNPRANGVRKEGRPKPRRLRSRCNPIAEGEQCQGDGKVGQAHWTPCAPPLLSHSLSQTRW